MDRLSITSITFNDGTAVRLPKDSMVLIVGPNNSGKSQALKDVNHLVLYSHGGGGVVVTAVEYEWLEATEIESWANSNLKYIDNAGQRVYQTPSGSFNIESLRSTIIERRDYSAYAQRIFMYADGTYRLNAGNPVSLSELTDGQSDIPLLRLYRSVALEKQLDAQARAAFQEGVLVDRHQGAMVTLRIGDRPPEDFVEHVPTDNYIEELRKLPTLDQQGDGVRAYIGLLLFAIAGNQYVVLVDEPEAFLHPPQSRRLGRVFSSRTETQQVIAATHSADFLRGALQCGNHVSVVRLTRSGQQNYAAVLDHDALQKLWSDPILKYSNILDGLFHDAVVLCESDADCMYYSAVLEHLYSDEPNGTGLDLLFVYSSTMHRFETVASALRAVDVPVIIVADIDVLRSQDKLEKLVTTLDGNWGAVAKYWSAATQGLEGRQPLRKVPLQDAIARKMSELADEVVGDHDIEQLRRLLKTESGWDRLKQVGVPGLSAGDQTVACQKLIDDLQEAGLLVVPVGELERFVPEVGGHGPAWATKVLEGMYTRGQAGRRKSSSAPSGMPLPQP